MPEVELSAGTIDYEDTGGSGPTIVFVHGLIMDGSLWRHVVADLRGDYCSWSGFVAEFAFDDVANWIFRGQADYEWGLGTSLQRAFNKARISRRTHRVHVAP